MGKILSSLNGFFARSQLDMKSRPKEDPDEKLLEEMRRRAIRSLMRKQAGEDSSETSSSDSSDDSSDQSDAAVAVAVTGNHEPTFRVTLDGLDKKYFNRFEEDTEKGKLEVKGILKRRCGPSERIKIQPKRIRFDLPSERPPTSIVVADRMIRGHLSIQGQRKHVVDRLPKHSLMDSHCHIDFILDRRLPKLNLCTWSRLVQRYPALHHPALKGFIQNFCDPPK